MSDVWQYRGSAPAPPLGPPAAVRQVMSDASAELLWLAYSDGHVQSVLPGSPADVYSALNLTAFDYDAASSAYPPTSAHAVPPAHPFPPSHAAPAHAPGAAWGDEGPWPAPRARAPVLVPAGSDGVWVLGPAGDVAGDGTVSLHDRGGSCARVEYLGALGDVCAAALLSEVRTLLAFGSEKAPQLQLINVDTLRFQGAMPLSAPVTRVLDMGSTVCVGLRSGAVQIIDPRLWKPVAISFQNDRYVGPVIDLHASSDAIAACGALSQPALGPQQPLLLHPQQAQPFGRPDPVVRLYDVRAGRSAGMVIVNQAHGGPTAVRFHPRVSSVLSVATHTGHVVTYQLRIGSSAAHTLISDVALGGDALHLTCLELPPSGDVFVAGDVNGGGHVFATKSPFRLHRLGGAKHPDLPHDYSSAAELPPLGHLFVNDPAALAAIGNPATLLSTIPDACLVRPRPLQPSRAVLPSSSRAQQRSSPHARRGAPARGVLPAAVAAAQAAGRGSRSPRGAKDYHLVQVPHWSRFRTDEFYRRHNNTPLSGIECTLRHGHIAAVMQALYSASAVRTVLASHLCRHEHCVACEAENLFYRLADAEQQRAAAVDGEQGAVPPCSIVALLDTLRRIPWCGCVLNLTDVNVGADAVGLAYQLLFAVLAHNVARGRWDQSSPLISNDDEAVRSDFLELQVTVRRALTAALRVPGDDTENEADAIEVLTLPKHDSLLDPADANGAALDAAATDSLGLRYQCSRCKCEDAVAWNSLSFGLQLELPLSTRKPAAFDVRLSRRLNFLSRRSLFAASERDCSHCGVPAVQILVGATRHVLPPVLPITFTYCRSAALVADAHDAPAPSPAGKVDGGSSGSMCFPLEFDVTLRSDGALDVRSAPLTSSGPRAMGPTVSYRLAAAVSHVRGDASHAVVHVRRGEQFFLINDFHVVPATAHDVVHVSGSWRQPAVLLYEAVDSGGEVRAWCNGFSAVHLSDAVFRLAHRYPRGRAVPSESAPSTLVPAAGELLAIDAEFVKLQREVSGPATSGTGDGSGTGGGSGGGVGGGGASSSATVRPVLQLGREALARVSVLRAGAELPDGPEAAQLAAVVGRLSHAEDVPSLLHSLREAAGVRVEAYPPVVFMDTFVACDQPVVDYLTRFSGVAPGDVDPLLARHHLSTRKLAQLQVRALAEFDAIFVGHGLANDFRILNVRVPPERVRDTVHLFHLPKQRYLSLRFLSYVLLDVDIQSQTHSSVEDAHCALLLYRVYERLAASGPGVFSSVLEAIYRLGRLLMWELPANYAALSDDMANYGADQSPPDVHRPSSALEESLLEPMQDTELHEPLAPSLLPVPVGLLGDDEDGEKEEEYEEDDEVDEDVDDIVDEDELEENEDESGLLL